MVDELELLKKDWKRKEENLPKLSYGEIRNMIWKKSSSIVKWILIISILEFTLPHLLYLLPSYKESLAIYDNIGLSNYFLTASVITYAIALYFILQFYKRFKEISVLDDSRSLMQKIIRTRKTVKNWVIFSLGMMMVNIAIIIMGIYLNDDITHAFPEYSKELEHVSPEKLKTSLMLFVGIFGMLLTLFMGLVYFMLYGLLLRKLNKNYKELEKLEL